MDKISRDDALAKRKSRLSPEKLALLEKLTGAKGEKDQPDIPRRAVETGPLPLSFAQQRLWFLHQFVPDSPAYNVVMAFHISGQLRINILEQSINEIIRRHEALRTTFQSVNGQPCQVIAPTLNIVLPVEELTGYPPEEREARFQQLAQTESQHIFDLTQGPLMHITLFRSGDEQYILLLNVHHIVIDGWSLGVFLAELTALYRAFSAGEPSPLPELSTQYADFAPWQRNWLQGDVLEQQLTYWREQLGKDKVVLELPTDRTRPPIQTFHGGSLKFEISSPLCTAIKEVCEKEQVTLFMLLVTALKVLLHRYSEQNIIRVGTPVANRNKVELEPLIGFFVNTLVLQTTISGSSSFTEVLASVRETANSAYGHQDIPFEVLVDELQPERNTSQNPLFEVCFVLQNVPLLRNVTPVDFTFDKFEEIRNSTSKFDLWIQVVEQNHGLAVDVEYNSDIFDHSTVSRIMSSFQVLLAGIVADPHTPVANLPLLTAQEEHQLLVEWNDTAVAYPLQDKCLHELVELQAQKSPHAPAVIFEGRHLTYAELEHRSTQLAHYLRSLGMQREAFVGIFLERSLEMVVGLLAVLKAGGAYVPLDPDYPEERLAFMLLDSTPPLLLTQQHLLERLPAYEGKIVCLDWDEGLISSESSAALASGVTPSNLAYMIYTSGSTGRPKGAMNTHCGIVNRLLWMQEYYQLNETDRVLQKTPVSFDVSVWEFFWPLITGACMVLARPESHKDPAYLARLIQKEKITTIHFVPTMLQVFLEEKESMGCQTLKRVVCSGEALSYALQQRFFECLPTDLFNLYGPTEAAVDVTFWQCQRASERKVVPLGRPVANTQIYLLDEYLNPVPVGVAGELHIGGVQVARGYYNRPELTHEKFIRDPFSGREGSRLYKTGDLARYLPDGTIEFLGRVDSLVKLRGFRIELGEIEAVLEEHPSVQQAAVILYEAQQKQLVAYLVPNPQLVERANAATDGAGADEQVTDWQHVFDRAYKADHDYSADFNIVSWNSSYTGLPLADEEMREWVESTVERILRLQPRKVIEIGCGTGLLLARIAPQCEAYLGTDFSTSALEYVTHALIDQRQELSHVRLFKRYAHDFQSIEEEQVDVVVLNSVVQYFPNVSYLVTVLTEAVKVVREGGAIFVGDVRNFTLLEAFLTEAEITRAPVTLSLGQLRQRIQKRLRQEQELVIAPEWFEALQEILPQIRSVTIEPRRGHYYNELTRYRYDVTLHVGGDVAYCNEVCWQDWYEDHLSIERLSTLLNASQPEVVAISNIPNRRLELVNRYQAALAHQNDLTTVRELRQLASGEERVESVDPESLWQLGNELAYHVDLTWEPGSKSGSYQLFLWKKANGSGGIGPRIPQRQEKKPSLALEQHANNPLLDRLVQQLVPELRSYLKKKLPDYMIPTAFEFIKEMPVNANGKLERKAFPAPVLEIPNMEEDFVVPVTDSEKILAEAWANILGLEQVGIKNNFFSLGGDSIHSIRVVARVKEKGLELTPQHIFQYQTIAELAATLKSEASLQDRETVAEFRYSEHDMQKVKALLRQEDIEDVYPLWPFQKYMLRRCLTEQEKGLYLVQSLTLTPSPDELDPQHIQDMWQELVNRHELLRTSFIWEDLDEPLQIVHKHVQAVVTFQDWRSLSTSKQEARLEEYLSQDRECGSELSQPRGIRIFNAQMHGAFLSVFSFSYLCLDGWSFNSLFDEMSALLAGKKLDTQTVRPFKDSVALVKQEDLSKAEIYWRERLKDFQFPTPLASSIAINQQADERGFARQFLRISTETSDRLRELARDHQLTLGTLIQGAWALVQSYCVGKDDVVYGLVSNGRPANLRGVEAMVGPFLNILPMRVRIEKNDSIVVWMKSLMQQAFELSQYQQTSLMDLQNWNVIPHDQFFAQNYLVFQNVTSKEIRAMMPNHFFVSKMGFPMRVDVYPERELAIHLSYYRHIFNDCAISLLLRSFEKILEDIVVSPEQRHLQELVNALEQVPLIVDKNPPVFYEGAFRIADIAG